MKKIILLLLIIAFLPTAHSQDNTVLWKISGNGLSKPSYLYGTVHLSDKRVFFANDSLPYFIGACNTFANELHPDSLNALMFNKASKEDTSDVYKNTFDQNDYDLINQKLLKEKGINLSQLKRKDLRTLRMLMNPSKKHKDDYPTFLDGYLTGIAKRSGCDIIGLESIDNHEKALDIFKDDDQYKKNLIELSKEKKTTEIYIEELIKTYQKGDLKSIENHYADFSFEFLESLLFYRNRVMTRTIDSVIQKQTLFATCGAAHLVGEKGIIELLRKKGYVLTPILSKGREYLDMSKLPESYRFWKTTNIPNLGISCKFPGIPGNTVKSLLYSEMKLYSDITSGCTYVLFPVSAAINIDDKEKFFAKYKEIMASKYLEYELKEEKKIVDKGLEGKQFLFRNDNFLVKTRLFIENNILYVAVANYNDNKICETETDYFFNNISIFKPVEEETYHYTNTKWNFEMDFPSKPVEKSGANKKNGPRTETLSLKSVDNIRGIYYLIEASEAGPGHYFPNDTSVLNKVAYSLKSMEKALFIKDSIFFHEGNMCVQVEGFFTDSSYLINTSILRGFKYYNTMAAMPVATYRQHRHEAFYNSFAFIPFKEEPYEYYTCPIDSTLLIKFPEKPYINKNDTIDEKETPLYKAYDKQTAYTYYVQKDLEGSYYYTQSDSDKWATIENVLVDYNDTLLSSKGLQFGNIQGRKFVIGSKTKSSVDVFTILDFGTYKIKVLGYFPKNDNESQKSEVFEDIIYKGTKGPEIISDTIAFRKLINDLNSSDSTKRDESRRTLSSFKIKDNLFTELTNAIDTLNIEADSLDYIDYNTSLILKLRDLDSKKTFPYIKKKLRGDEYASTYATLLADIKTTESYDNLKVIYSQNINRLSEFSTSLYKMQDSMALSLTLFPDILEALEKDTSENYALINLANALLDSGILSYDIILPYEAKLMKISSDQAKTITIENDLYSTYYNNSILELLEHNKNKSGFHSHLKDLSNSKNVWAAYSGMFYLVKDSIPINEKVMKKICAIPYFRNVLFDDLISFNKLKLFPSKYNNQKALAEGDLYHVLYDYDELIPLSVKFIKSVNIDESYAKGTYFLYEVILTGEEKGTSYLYTTGPYNEEKNVNNGAQTGYIGEYFKDIEDIMLKGYLSGSN
ncbi:MAG: TraB/GumN family protein [Bacteroidota bacterium]|nr:TraB/GumN family protein [Bacteroidota bacterium]